MQRKLAALREEREQLPYATSHRTSVAGQEKEADSSDSDFSIDSSSRSRNRSCRGPASLASRYGEALSPIWLVITDGRMVWCSTDVGSPRLLLGIKEGPPHDAFSKPSIAAQATLAQHPTMSDGHSREVGSDSKRKALHVVKLPGLGRAGRPGESTKLELALPQDLAAQISSGKLTCLIVQAPGKQPELHVVPANTVAAAATVPAGVKREVAQASAREDPIEDDSTESGEEKSTAIEVDLDLFLKAADAEGPPSADDLGACTHYHSPLKAGPRAPAATPSSLVTETNIERMDCGDVDCLGFQVSTSGLSLDCAMGDLDSDDMVTLHAASLAAGSPGSPHGNLLSLSGFYPSSGGGAHKPWRDGSRSASSACPLQPDRSPSSSCGYHGSPWKNITGTTSDGGSSSAKPLGWENLLPSDHDIIRALAAVSP